MASSGATKSKTSNGVPEDGELYAGADTGSQRAARHELLELLASRGASIEQLREGVREQTLATMPLEFTLSDERQYTLTDMADEAGVESPYLRQLLLSLGHPNPRPREQAFGEQDLAVARILRVFLDAGLHKEGLLEIARVMGHSMARTASVIREVAGSELIQPGDSEATVAIRYATAAENLLPMLGEILQYELRVHVREQATRDVITRAELASGELSGMRLVTVGFVDLSGFTRLGSYSSAQQLGMIGSRLAALAAQVSDPPVELVKTLGDGAMLVSTDAEALVSAVCELADRVDAEGDDFPALRGGIALGPAVARGADWFGASVNTASRIVEMAKPSAILADEATRDRTEDRFKWSRKRSMRRLKGLEGRPKIFSLQRQQQSS
jgi:adenylate cyclase